MMNFHIYKLVLSVVIVTSQDYTVVLARRSKKNGKGSNYATKKGDCSIIIGDRVKDSNEHRRLIQSTLADNCELQDTLTIENFVNGLKQLFTKIMSYTREEEKGGQTNFTYWYGEEKDGSTLNYIKDATGQMFGSLVDVKNHNILQFQVHDGVESVLITNSSTFPPEIEVEPVGIGTYTPLEDIARLELPTTILPEGSIRPKYDDSGKNLDVMIVWTKGAECENSRLTINCEVTDQTAASMKTLINLAISETNAAYELSGVFTQLLLVHSFRHPTYVIQDFSKSLSELKDGKVFSVHELRQKYGADIVVMIGERKGYCGIGYIGPSKDFMYSVTAWNCATGYFTFGHEIGHNLGLRHDRGTSSACNQDNKYNYGYRDPDAQFRSILAYNCRSDQCDKNKGDGPCTRIQRFSNILYPYNGKPVGSKSENSARHINSVKSEVAGYMPHKALQQSITIDPSPTPSIAPSIAPSSNVQPSITNNTEMKPSTWPSSSSSSTTSPSSLTMVPSSMTSSSPSLPPPPIPPSSFCMNTIYSFNLKMNKKKMVTDCMTITKDVNTFCSLEDIQFTCPLACNTCSKCDDSPFKFKKVNILKSCKALKDENDSRCDIEDVKVACRKTCGICPG